MRVGFRTLGLLALSAAAAAAALAHFAVDVVGDFALAHDSYDHIAHASREFVSGGAVIGAVLLGWLGLRHCCEIASRNRTRLRGTDITVGDAIAFIGGVIGLTAILVPAMELLDAGAAGVPVRVIGDAFGGSLLLGGGTTVVCAALVASCAFAFVRWLIACRHAFVSIIETLLDRSGGEIRPSHVALKQRRLSFLRRRAPSALRLSKRGPPGTAFA